MDQCGTCTSDSDSQSQAVQQAPESTVQDPSKLESERKITQTDHINKKLLGAFLDRLNQGDNSVAFGLDPQSILDEREDEFIDRTDSLTIVEKSDLQKQ